MEKLKPSPTEKPTPSIKDLDVGIEKLLDPKTTEDDCKAYWNDPNFTQLFPNMTFRLLSLEGSKKYTQEQKQRIFELGFTSFMKLPWQGKGVTLSLTMAKINEKTQLWKRAKSRTEEPSRESLISLEIGCLILLGLSLENKQDAINLIIESYNNPIETTNKRKSFRNHIMNNLIRTGSPFRQWVKDNNLDTNNGFEWNSEVTKLGLQLLPQHKFPTEFNDLKNYPPPVIAEFLDYILGIETGAITNHMRSNISKFQAELTERLKSSDFSDYPKLDELQQKLNQLNTNFAVVILGSPAQRDDSRISRRYGFWTSQNDGKRETRVK